MRLLREDDVVRAVDKHTLENDQLDDDITCILEEVQTATEKFVEWLKEMEKESKEFWEDNDDEQAFGEMIAYTNVLSYLRSHGILGDDEE